MKKTRNRGFSRVLIIFMSIIVIIFLFIFLSRILSGEKENNEVYDTSTEENSTNTMCNTIESDISQSDEFTISSSEDGEEQTEVLPTPIPLKDQSVAIIGDSISAFSEYNAKGYAACYPAGDIEDVSKMWWYLVQEKTGITYTAIAAYSGGTVTGDSRDMSDGLASCSDKRIIDLVGNEGKEPDTIIIFNGVNDFINAIPIGNSIPGKEDISEGVQTNFQNGYALMLTKIKDRYPLATIYCCTLMDCSAATTIDEHGQYINNIGLTIKDYNKAIRDIALYYGATIIETSKCGISYNTFDTYTIDNNVHPNTEGMKLVANTIFEGLRKSE